MTGATTVAGHGERLGLVAMRLIAAGLFALFLASMMAEAADAAPSPGSYQNGFTRACRDNGGTPKRVRSRVVKCTLADGTTITCDFNVNPPDCKTKKPVAFEGAAGGGAVVSTEDGVLTQAEEPAPSEPVTHVSGARPSGGTMVLVTDDDQP